MSEDLTQNLPNNDLKLILVRLDSMDARLNVIDTRLTKLEDKVERRLLETRPIWESVLEQLKEISAQLKEANARLTRVEVESIDLRRLFRAGFNDLARVQDNFDDRLEKLEGHNKPG